MFDKSGCYCVVNNTERAQAPYGERGDGRIPGLKKGFPGEGGSMDFDALLDRVEAGIAERLRELEAGNVASTRRRLRPRMRAARITTKERL